MSQEDPRLEFPPGLSSGTILENSFRVEAVLGRGGMGLVLSATDLSSKRKVAIKLLPQSAVQSGEEAAQFARRFERETEVLRAIRHPNIVEYLRAGVLRDGSRYLAMELLEGETILARARREALQLSEVLEIGAQACDALDHAHVKGVVHRDLKPANLFLCAGPRLKVKLIDFGIARFLDDRRRVTRVGGFVGTPAYMAPEQLRGEEQIDGRADLYSLAVTLYEAMSRKLPIEGPDTVSLLLKVLSERPRPIRELRKDVPPALERIFSRALAKSPKDRYPNAAEMADAFRAARQNPGGVPDTTRVNRPLPRFGPEPSSSTLPIVQRPSREGARPSFTPYVGSPAVAPKPPARPSRPTVPERPRTEPGDEGHDLSQLNQPTARLSPEEIAALQFGEFAKPTRKQEPMPDEDTPTHLGQMGAVPMLGDDIHETEIVAAEAPLLRRERSAAKTIAPITPTPVPAAYLTPSEGAPLYARGQSLSELRRVIVVLVAGPEGQPAPASITRASSALAEAGGLVDALYDGRVAALFGASHSYGDEARRAVRAALRARAADLRVGIGSGRVLSSDEGGAVPKANALLARAALGEILISEETFRRVRGLFDVEPGPDGASRVLVERTGGVLIGTRSLLGVETPTAGREAELRSLRQALTESLRGGETRGVLLLGEAGAGKSRLKFETRLLLEELRISALYLEGTGDPIRAQAPYALLGAALRMCGELRAEDPAPARRKKVAALYQRLMGQSPPKERADQIVTLLSAALGVEAPGDSLSKLRQNPVALRAELEELLFGLLSAAARREPVALVLEDMQWVDPGSLAILERLLGQPRSRLFFLGLSRPSLIEAHPGFLSQPPHQRVQLGPLDKEATSAILRALLGAAPEELVGYLHDATGGNPCLIEELLSALWDKGILAQDASGALTLAGDPAALRVPAGAEALLQSRLDHLPQAEKEALKFASVFGRLFWAEGLAAMGIPDAAARLEKLRGREFITLRHESRFTGIKEYAFRHALLHSVAYGLLPEAEREGLHAKAVSWLESVGEEDIATLARHYELSNDEPKAAERYAEAASRAAAEYAPEAALSYLARAKALETRPPRRFSLLLLEEDLCFWSGARAQGREALSEMAQLAAALNEPHARYLVDLREGRFLNATGEFGRAEELLRRARAAAQQHNDAETELLAAAPLARSLVNLARYDEGIALCRQSLPAARTQNRPDQLGQLLYYIGIAHAHKGEHSLCVRYLEEALAAARSAGDQRLEASAITSIASSLVNLGCYPEAERYNRDAISAAQRAHNATGEVYGWLNLGNSLALAGRFDEGEGALTEAFDLALRYEVHSVPDAVRCYLARLYLLRGEPGDAQLALDLANQVLAASSGANAQMDVLAYLWRARALLALGDPSRALGSIDTALRLRDDLGSLEEDEEEILYAHYLVLYALRRAGEAWTALVRANAFVEARAQRLGDANYREAYLHRALAPAAIRSAFSQSNKAR